jgi:hypothetical protein
MKNLGHMQRYVFMKDRNEKKKGWKEEREEKENKNMTEREEIKFIVKIMGIWYTVGIIS